MILGLDLKGWFIVLTDVRGVVHLKIVIIMELIWRVRVRTTRNGIGLHFIAKNGKILLDTWKIVM